MVGTSCPNPFHDAEFKVSPADSNPNASKIGGYTLTKLLGRGGMGTVYQGVAPNGQLVAVKILADHLVDNDVLRTRFYLEAKLAMTIDHPNIVRALYVGEENARHYLVMEFVDGESVNQRLKRVGKFDGNETKRIGASVARALDKAHREGLVHRDVKPDNILLAQDGTAKLTDLGLAKKAEIELDLTRTGRGLGTPYYMAPEQFRNAKNVDAKSDIYALGVTLYVMATGTVPFRGDGPLDTFMKKSKNLYTPISEIEPGLDRRLIQTIECCLSADVDRRPASAQAIAEYLEGSNTELPLGYEIKDLVKVVEKNWWVKCPLPDGTYRRLHGPETVIRKQIRQGKIGPNSLASTKKSGPFAPITEFGEFRDDLIAAAESPSKSGSRLTSPRPLADSHISEPTLIHRLGLNHPAFWITISIGILGLALAAWRFLIADFP